MGVVFALLNALQREHFPSIIPPKISLLSDVILQVQCKACSMVLLKGDREEIASHFAFSHTDDMKRILKDRTPV